MYWEAKSFDLPNLPKGRSWKVMIDTFDNTFHEELLKPAKPVKPSRAKKKQRMELSKKTVVPPRSTVVFVEE